MTDADAFLQAIIAAPDDDVPRLVFADYLEELGEERRAEFIRTHVASSTALDGEERREAALRAAELLAEHRAEWVIPHFRAVQKFRRGFIESIATTAERLLTSAERVFAHSPIRELRIYNLGGWHLTFAALAELDRIEILDLSNHFRIPLEELFPLAPLGRLHRLVLRNCGIWGSQIAPITEAKFAARLTSLDLSGNPIGDAGLENLAQGSDLSSLVELTIRGDEQPYENCIHANGLSALLESGLLKQLRTLDLRGQYVGDGGAVTLADSPDASQLEELDLSNNEIGLQGERALIALVESPHLARLKILRLGGHRNEISPLALEALQAWRRPDRVLEL